MQPERVSDNINRALHTLFDSDERLYLLGEDILDPYGGAFRVTRGLSTSHPDRVLSTPLSESGIVGVANGLALSGNRAIVEIMFGDFLVLGFDQLINFAAKSVAMYGCRVPMPIVVRCPVGGNRGYGPTHSQSLQKHLVGVPHLNLFEMSPFHDAEHLLRTAFDRAEPSVFLEDKVLYTQRMFGGGRVDDLYSFRAVPGPGNWVRVDQHGAGVPDVLLMVGGGMVHRAIEAAHRLYEQEQLVTTLLVPGQLYPLELDEVATIVEAVGLVCVAEEAPVGGTWGAEVAVQLYPRVWDQLKAPIELIASGNSIIPAAPHLEREVLAQSAAIVEAISGLAAHARRRSSRAIRAPLPVPEPAVQAAAGHQIIVPTLNTNDVSCILIDWLLDDGDAVLAGNAIATVETSKATTDIEAEQSGVLRRLRKIGEEVRFGDPIGYIVGPLDLIDVQEPISGPAGSAVGSVAASSSNPLVELVDQPPSRNQSAIAKAVSTSHRTIPAAFGAVDVDLDEALSYLAAASEASGAELDLPSLLVKALAALHVDFPVFFGTVTDGGTVRRLPADIGITVDAGAGLFIPVMRAVDTRSIADIADDLIDIRMAALDGRFDEDQLTGAAISVSLNIADGMAFVQPLILPPQACMVSFAGRRRQLRLGGDGQVRESIFMTVGLAYDHRVINGREATDFLLAFKNTVEHPDGSF